MKSHPKKRFGQHFLRDTGILGRLERLIQPASTDCIVEIGAGDGALSCRLAPAVKCYVALEVDGDLMPDLLAALAPHHNANALHADVLALDMEELIADSGFDPSRTRLLGNLPYNIASEIVRRSLRLRQPVLDMIFMVQLEVAHRIVSPPGSRAYGYLSVDCQHRADVRMLLKVPPACFAPRPAVTSAVVQLRPRKRGLDPEADVIFDALVKAAFAHRRKTLENSFRLNPIFEAAAAQFLEQAQIEGKRRAEDLTVSEYECLALACQRLGFFRGADFR